MKKIFQDRENRISVIFFVITMLVACSPLISRYCINGHDLDYHLLRIESLKEAFRVGRPFLKVNTLFYGGAGYASTMFYSDLFMHIPALLRLMHVSIGKSFHIYSAIIFILCYLSTYYSVWKMSLSKFSASIAAMLLTLCPYHMDDMLVRTACGESAAFIFLPLAVYGIFNVVCEDMDNPMAFGLGFAGLILTHPATCLMAVGFGIVVFLFNIRSFMRNSVLMAKVCIVSTLALLVTSYQWLPMLEQFASAEFYVANNWTDLFDAAVDFSALAASSFPTMGLMLFVLIIPRAFLTRSDYPILKYVDLMLIAGIVFAVGATRIMPWERVADLFGFLQFPWRLFIMSSVLLAMADAIVLRLFLERISEDKRMFALDVAMIVLTALMAQGAITHQNAGSMGYYDYSDDYYNYKPYTINVVAGEWLPQTVEDPGTLLDMSEHFVFDDGSENEFTRYRAKVIANIESEHEYADVPFIYYKGYSAVIKDALGNKTKLVINGEGDNGMCRVMLGGAKGELTVSYTGTLLQYISYIVTVLFLLLIFDLVYLKNKYKKKLKARAAAAGANLGKIACISIAVLSALTLSGCNVNVQSYQPQNDYSDPDRMIDYLRDKNGEGTQGDGIDESELIKIRLSQKGYDTNGRSYAVLIDESSGEQVISVLTLKQAEEILKKDIETTDGLYDKLLEEEIATVKKNYRSDGFKERIMNTTDALLCMEVFPETSKGKKIDALAGELAGDIINIPKIKIPETIDKYNCAAALAKAAYILPDWDQAEYAATLAEEYFKDAESIVGEDDENVASRLWAAAELYRLTGQKTYRSVVDAIAMDVIPVGSRYEDPGYFGLFAYLMSPYPTNYNVCTDMMDVVFSEANDLIKESVDIEFMDARLDDQAKRNDEKTGKRMLEEAFLVTMTNYVSVSVEYKGFVQNRLNFIYGANLSGTDLTQDDEALCDMPKMFVLTGLSTNGN